MKTLYIITGPAGVGKSTISKRIAESLEKSALIDGDEIYHQVVSGYVSAWKEGNHLELFLENCIDLIENYIDYEFDVVFNYILNKEDLKKITNKIHNANIKFICLMTDEKELLKRDSLREEDCRMNERCLILLNSFTDQKFNTENTLDTTNLTIEETVLKIIEDDSFILK